MYKLAREISISHHFAIVTGGAYMLCGIFVGHAQSLVSVLGATWLPWVVAYYLRMIDSGFRLPDILKLALFTFLMLTGGYQAVSFMLFYLLITFFIYKALLHIGNRHFVQLKQLILSNLLFAAILVILCGGMIISVFYVFPFVERLSGLPYELSCKYAFTPQSLISLFFPFAATTNKEFFNTDISITNGFTGVIILTASVLGLFRKKSPYMTIMMVFGGIFLLASFGKYTPVQKFFYNYVPFLNLFRFPSFYRYFTIIALLLLAGNYFTWHTKAGKLQPTKSFLWFLGLSSGFYLICILISMVKLKNWGLTCFQDQYHIIDRIRNTSVYEHIFIQGILQFGVLGSFFFLAIRKRQCSQWKILAFVFIELVLAVQLNLPVTGYGKEKPQNLKETLQRFPEGFPVPDGVPLMNNSDSLAYAGVLWRNMGNFTKQVSASAFSSFLFADWMNLIDNYPSLRDSILSHKLVWLSDDLRNHETFGDSVFSNRTAFVKDPVWEEFPKHGFDHSRDDTVFITSFRPDRIVCSVSLESSQWLNLTQNDYIGWKVFLDGKPVDHYTTNLSLIGLPVPAGKHEVIFAFEMNTVKTGFIVSVIGFFLLVLFIYYFRLRKAGHSASIGFLLTILLGSLLFVLYILIKDKRKNDALESRLEYDRSFSARWQRLPDKTFVLASWDDLKPLDSLDFNEYITSYLCQTIRSENVVELSERLSGIQYECVYYLRRNTAENPDVAGLLNYLYRESETIIKDRNLSQVVFVKNLPGSEIHTLSFDAEDHPEFWKINGKIDSSDFYSAPSSCHIGPDCLYGPGFETNGKNTGKKKDALLSFNGRIFWSKPQRSYLVIHITREGQTVLYNTENLLNYSNLRDNWYVFSQSIRLPDHIRAGDKIKAYIWNPGRADFRVDDLQVKIVN
jgi:hypothetical protein